MIHVLNNLTSNYELQMVLLEMRIGNKSDPLGVNELCEELKLCYERVCNLSQSNNESKPNEEHALFASQFQGKFRGCGKIGHKAFQCKSKTDSNDRPNDGVSQHVKISCFKLIRRAEGNMGGNVRTEVADVVFHLILQSIDIPDQDGIHLDHVR
jgi:hypothetical protein